MSDTPHGPERLAYSLDEFLEAVPIGRTTMFRLISEGKLRTVTIGRRRFVPVDAADDLVRGGAA